ncbi:MAG: PEP-CTERM sorting domain-containing protein [Candidatus Omnitrophica bacterium]|nr:PEP-CTERM sorting domain-containing protein [Candidatus Omnitrophota bacterium]
MKKLLVVLGIAVIATFAAQAVAQAADVAIEVGNLYDWGTLYSWDGSQWNADYANPSGGLGESKYEETYANAGFNEDTWGLFRVNTIIEPGNVVFDRGDDPYELTGIFYGFDDVWVDGFEEPGPSPADPHYKDMRILSVGGKVLLYQDYSKNYPVAGALIGDRNDETVYNYFGDALDGFPGVTEGTLVLAMTGHIRYNAPLEPYTYRGTIYLDRSVQATLYLDVVGGLWADQYNTNAVPVLLWDGTPAGTYADMKFTIEVTSPIGLGDGDWVIKGGTGSAIGYRNVIPEPASMSLLGLGLLSTLGIIRKKK